MYLVPETCRQACGHTWNSEAMGPTPIPEVHVQLDFIYSIEKFLIYEIVHSAIDPTSLRIIPFAFTEQN